MPNTSEVMIETINGSCFDITHARASAGDVNTAPARRAAAPATRNHCKEEATHGHP